MIPLLMSLVLQKSLTFGLGALLRGCQPSFGRFNDNSNYLENIRRLIYVSTYSLVFLPRSLFAAGGVGGL